MFSPVTLGPFPPSQGALSILYFVILLIILLFPEIFALPSSKSQKHTGFPWLKCFPCSFARLLQLKAYLPSLIHVHLKQTLLSTIE